MTSLETLARGIAAGESLSFSNADFRLQYMSPRRVFRTRSLNLKSDELKLTNVARPYAHSNPPSQLHPGPGENLEWFVFTALAHRRVAAGVLAGPEDAWHELSTRDPELVRSRLAIRIALNNLRRGLRPPQSGHDNPHYFDDIAMIRALAAVAVLGQNDDAVRAAVRSDAQATHALDGLWCAVAASELFIALGGGAPAPDAVRIALEVLPEQTWSRRVALASVDVAMSSSGPIERARRLSIEVGDWLYSYPISAPETLGFLLAHVAAAVDANDLLLGALQGRNASTLPALAGAAAAVLFGTEWIPRDEAMDHMRLTGLCLPEFAGEGALALLE